MRCYGKEHVTIGLVYQNYARSKPYDKAFKETIRNINTGQSISIVRKLSTVYELVPMDCILPKGRFFPADVLDCLCEVIVKNQVATIIFVTSGEDFDGRYQLNSPRFVTFRKHLLFSILLTHGKSNRYPYHCLEFGQFWVFVCRGSSVKIYVVHVLCLVSRQPQNNSNGSSD